MYHVSIYYIYIYIYMYMYTTPTRTSSVMTPYAASLWRSVIPIFPRHSDGEEVEEVLAVQLPTLRGMQLYRKFNCESLFFLQFVGIVRGNLSTLLDMNKLSALICYKSSSVLKECVAPGHLRRMGLSTRHWGECRICHQICQIMWFSTNTKGIYIYIVIKDCYSSQFYITDSPKNKLYIMFPIFCKIL